MSKVLLVGEPVEEKLNEPGDVLVLEEGHFLQLQLSPVPGHVLKHEGVDQGDEGPHLFQLHPRGLALLLLRGVAGLFVLLLFLDVTALLVDGVAEHHEEDEEQVEVVGLVLLLDFGQQLAEHVGACLFVDLLVLVELGLELVGDKGEENLVEVATGVYFLEGSIVLEPLHVGHEIAESVDAVCRYVLGVAVAVVDLLLNRARLTCLGRPLLLAYSERGFITCPGA